MGGQGWVWPIGPSQCNGEVTVRDERALRVLARDNDGVDDGWLCDKGRFGYQSFHVPERITEPLLRDGGVLRPVPWERALEEAAAGLRRAGEHAAAITGGHATNEAGYLLPRLMLERLATLAGRDPGGLRELAAMLRGDGAQGTDEKPREVVILFGERLLSGPDGAAGATALLQIAKQLDLGGIEGAGLLEIPSGANGRGLPEAGVLPNAGPGHSEPPLARCPPAPATA